MLKKKPVVFILGISSDIGMFLAGRYSQDGYQIAGTYRNYSRNLKNIGRRTGLFHCDISRRESIKKFFADFKNSKIRWDIFISCVGDLRPYGSFLNADFDEWGNSVNANSIAQLRILHGLYPFKNKKSKSAAIFFAGAGTNNAAPGLSAYAVSKIMLIKMCELIDAESRDLNIFIVGPGFIKTKIHRLIKKNINPGKKETKLEEVYGGINWLISQGKEIAGGRNFAIANDSIGGNKGKILAKKLLKNADMYKLRRFKN